MSGVPVYRSFRKFTVSVCVPVAKLPFTVVVSSCPDPCSDDAVSTPPICLPSTLTVYCALPWKASWLIFSTRESGPLPIVVFFGVETVPLSVKAKSSGPADISAAVPLGTVTLS